MLDDCSRLFTGSRIYERELLLSYFDFLPAAFLAHGRPLQLYVDYHSIFFEKPPGTGVVLCLHPSGLYSVLAAHPDPKQKTALLFTNRSS
jgi:hypothetical protein